MLQQCMGILIPKTPSDMGIPFLYWITLAVWVRVRVTGDALRRLKIRKHRQLYLRPTACESRRLFQPKKVSVLAGEGGQSSSNKMRRKMIKETTRVFLHEKSKKHTNDVNDKDLFSLQQSKLLFQISHLRLINLQNSKF